MIGSVLCAVTALAFVGIGVGAIMAPGSSAQQYGIVVSDPRALAYLRAMGVRDLVLGVVLALVTALGSATLLATSVGVCALVAFLDFAVVLLDRDRSETTSTSVSRGRSLTLHAGGALGLIGAATFVALGW